MARRRRGEPGRHRRIRGSMGPSPPGPALPGRTAQGRRGRGARIDPRLSARRHAPLSRNGRGDRALRGRRGGGGLSALRVPGPPPRTTVPDARTGHRSADAVVRDGHGRSGAVRDPGGLRRLRRRARAAAVRGRTLRGRAAADRTLSTWVRIPAGWPGATPGPARPPARHDRATTRRPGASPT